MLKLIKLIINMKIALITSCLAGVAHSKMAAMALKKEAEKRGHEIHIEEQGGHKVPVKLTLDQIEEADIVIIAKMVTISGKDRFKSKLILDVSVNKAVRNPISIIDQAESLLASS
jgi:fructose-specific phosphotransferase system IIB component